MRAYVLILALCAAAVVDAVIDASTTKSTKQRVDTVMDAVEEHCSARRKRSVLVSQRSDDKVRGIIYRAIAECLADDPKPTYPTVRPSSSPSTRTSRKPATTESTAKPTIPTTFIPPAGPCSSPATVNLTEDWRLDNKGSDIKPIDGDYNCDAPLFDNVQWFRITGYAGNRIRDSCSPSYSCGSHGGIWTNATHPDIIGDTWQVKLYGSWSDNCDWYPWQVEYPLTVMKCGPGNNYVYKIDGLTGCYHSVCGMWA